MKQYVVGFGFTSTGSVWLVKKNRQGVPLGWNGIGGKIEPFDRSASEAMAREWQEETGTVWPSTAREVCVLEGERFRVYFFAAELSERIVAVTNDAGEPLESFGQLPAGSVPNIRWLVPMAREALYRPGRGAPYFVRETGAVPA